jgi:membrane protein implicated in regulation of membrane protease activity
MFPNKIRAAGLAVAAAAQWLANFAISTSFPALAGLGLQFAYGLYALIALLSFVFVRKAVRETKGRELEDMDEEAPAATVR